ncbi:mediator complex subunit 13 C-terminal-domain-containing protein [Ephemerocybe angulata]|uniref:Mediator of RNA polymerase II transcription subunit 13 n=1 Tax=Ephemerocybe angulata TaxID=980116 RepID=A0A8H6H902_9AGAR|nr:mediator complex subunit 13 C-terminal-domain-containing protein [Tulosesus angulatus]
MASKPSSALPMPPTMSTGAALLAATIPLPPTPCVAVAVYSPAPTSPDSQPAAHDAIELARRAVILHNASSPILDSVLTSVRSGKEPKLYLFLIIPHESASAAVERLSGLQFENLHQISRSTFQMRELSSSDPTGVRTHSHFLDAVRSNILSDLSQVEVKGHVFPKRLQDGFVLERNAASSDWASGWNQGSHRPIIHFRLQIHISWSESEPSRLVVHAVPRPTPYSSLSPTPNPGSPIVLMPYGTPAYYLNTYSGPSNALVKQFRESLRGLGAGDWESPAGTSDASRTPFVIGWIRVENRQGEDKGTLVIWPSRLCLSYSDSWGHRPPLAYIPEMPAPLQASPQVPTTSRDGMIHNESIDESQYPDQPLPFHYESFQTPPHYDPLRAFHSLTASKSKDIRYLANEVGGYVDSVVRERERERERLKKEREAGTGSSPKLGRNPVSSSTSTRPSASTPLPAGSTSQLSQPAVLPAVTNLSHAHQAQVFYPSPPQSGQTHPPVPDNTSPDMGAAVLPTNPVLPPPPKTPVVPPIPPSHSDIPNNGSDLFNNYSNWPQSSDSYMDMGMDFTMDMDMGFNMDMDTSRTGAAPTYTNHRPSQLNFNDAFTDDDFSFFDLPSKAEGNVTSAVPQSAPLSSTSTDFIFARPSLPLQQPSPSLIEHRASGPGPPPLQAPWTPATQGDAPTPQHFDRSEFHPAGLIPSSPGPSPEPHLTPETPTVQLAFESSVKQPVPTRALSGPVVFDAIPFSASHKSTDTKYSFGKFALPSPSPEPGYEDHPPTPPVSSPLGKTWRARYNSATDPRIGVVKQLIGAKRKASPTPHSRNGPPSSSAWMDVAEDNEVAYQGDAMNVSSDSDSEDGNNDEDSECDSPQLSRPSTPSPSYLPLGPTLLHVHFDHTQLLPISTPLRSPGAIALRINQSPSAPFASVPTPVSPAAALGAASEQSKSLESAAFSIATEFVENSLWADIWKTNNQRSAYPATVWPDDIKGAADVLRQLRGAGGLSNLSTIFALDSSAKLEPFEPPYISIGKGDAVIQLLPSALRFWEKLDLGPKGGRKDIEIYALYEDFDDQKRTTVDTWLSAAGAFYKARHMGQFIRGCTNPANDALLPVRFDATFRKTLTSFISNIINAPHPIVIILFVPVTAMTMASPALRTLLSSTKKALNTFEGQIIFHLVPDSHLVDLEHSPRGYPLLDEFCTSIYNRIHVGVERNLSRRMHGSAPTPNLLFQEPSFTLSRPLHSKVTYVHSTHASLDVVDRFTLLHIGYQLSSCKRWVLASCVDQRGEEYDLGLWLMHPDEDAGEGADSASALKGEEAFVIDKVWNFALDFARKVDVEWQVVITKLGLMSPREVQVWTDQFERQEQLDREERLKHPRIRYTPLHVTLASADSNTPWTLVEPNPMPLSPTKIPRTPANLKHTAHFSDVSASFYAIFPHSKLSVGVPPDDHSYSASLVCEPPLSPTPSQELPAGGGDPSANPTVSSGSPQEDDLPHPIPFIPLSTSTLIRLPYQPSETPIDMLHIHVLKHLHTAGASEHNSLSDLQVDITRNFYELAVLSNTRFRLDKSPILPFHLAAIDSMRFCLDCDWEYLEGSSAEP